MEKMNQIDPKKILYGSHIGEHGYKLDELTDEVKRLCVDRGMNFVIIRVPGGMKTPIHDYLISWAKYCAENKLYFIYLYTLQFAMLIGQKSYYTPEVVEEIKRVAGEYYMGDMIGEPGSRWIGALPGFYTGEYPKKLPIAEDMQAAKDSYVKEVKRHVDIDRALGVDKVSVVESSMIVTYDLEAGIDYSISEIMPRDPERIMAISRGTMKAFDRELWGTYFAHEWYAGNFHDDMLKRKRLESEYKYAYLNGSNVICHESGDELMNAHGREFGYDSEVCRDFRAFIQSFGEYINSDDRPKGQPITRIAFVQGNLDSQRGGNGGCFVWGQYDRKDWGYSEPEWSWRITDEVNRKSRWFDPFAFECDGKDFTGQVPYGTYDIIPATAPHTVMSQYDTLIYAGWNTMTEEQLENLEKFVENGGTLLISAAHMNASAKRVGEFTPIRGGDISKLCGCTLTGKQISYNYGVKFRSESLVEGMQYPTTLMTFSDPKFSEGYIDYAVSKPAGGTVITTIEDSFNYVDQPGLPNIIENKLGKGNVIFMTSSCYPGRGALYPLYSMVVRALMQREVKRARVRVLGPDTLRYSVYEDGSVYLLNTDCDLEYTVKVYFDGKETSVSLSPLELKHIKLGSDITI